MREFSRVIANPTVRKSAREQWNLWFPRVLCLGSKSSSPPIAKLLKEHTEHSCKKITIFIHMIVHVHCVTMYQISFSSQYLCTPHSSASSSRGED